MTKSQRQKHHAPAPAKSAASAATATPAPAPTKRENSLRDHLVRVGEDLFVSAIVAAIVSGASLAYFEGRLENSKANAEMLIASEEKFDDSHNAVLSAFGLYANKLFTTNDEAQKEKILTAVIDAQSQLLRIRHQMGGKDDPAIAKYATDLNHLADAVRNISKPEQLGPAYETAQQLLADRDDVATSIKNNLHVTAF
jgi:hypothetical protein